MKLLNRLKPKILFLIFLIFSTSAYGNSSSLVRLHHDVVRNFVEAEFRLNDSAMNLVTNIGSQFAVASIQIENCDLEMRGIDLIRSKTVRPRTYLSLEKAEELYENYPSGIIPIRLKLYIAPNNTPNLRDHTYENKDLVFDSQMTLKIIPPKGNHEYKVGVVQVVPSGFKFEDYDLCLFNDSSNFVTGSIGRTIRGISKDCVESFDWGSNAPTITVDSIPIESLLFSEDSTTLLNNIVSSRIDSSPGSYGFRSLNSLKDAWPTIFSKHQNLLTHPNLGLRPNPTFKYELLPPVEEEIIPTNVSSEVESYFNDVVEENNINLNSYDFVVYLQYYSEISNQPRFSRGFARSTRVYVPMDLSSRDTLGNIQSYFTIVHELGHSFGAKDLYEGFSLRYPEAISDLQNLPNTDGCIMAKGFAKERTTTNPNIASKYRASVAYSWDSALNGLGISRFHETDLESYVLCPDSVAHMTGGSPNPNCTLKEFYQNRCGDCDARSFLNCQRDPGSHSLKIQVYTSEGLPIEGVQVNDYDALSDDLALNTNEKTNISGELVYNGIWEPTSYSLNLSHPNYRIIPQAISGEINNQNVIHQFEAILKDEPLLTPLICNLPEIDEPADPIDSNNPANNNSEVDIKELISQIITYIKKAQSKKKKIARTSRKNIRLLLRKVKSEYLISVNQEEHTLFDKNYKKAFKLFKKTKPKNRAIYTQLKINKFWKRFKKRIKKLEKYV